jgi:hypothetical protein
MADMPKLEGEAADRLTAAVDLVNRTGALSFEIRYQDDSAPTVWIAVAAFHIDDTGRPERKLGAAANAWQVGAALHPLRAVHVLLCECVDGGICKHCNRPAGFDESFDAMPYDELICWYQWDPELKTYRRACEVTS